MFELIRTTKMRLEILRKVCTPRDPGTGKQFLALCSASDALEKDQTAKAVSVLYQAAHDLMLACWAARSQGHPGYVLQDSLSSGIAFEAKAFLKAHQIG